MFADVEFSGFAEWLVDLPEHERRVWWSWLRLYTTYLTCRRDLRERFSVN